MRIKTTVRRKKNKINYLTVTYKRCPFCCHGFLLSVICDLKNENEFRKNVLKLSASNVNQMISCIFFAWS